MRSLILLIAAVIGMSASEPKKSPWQGVQVAVNAGKFSDAIAIYEQQETNVKQACPAYALAFVVIAYDETNNARAAIIALDGIRSAAMSDRPKLSTRTVPMILVTLERHTFKESAVRRRVQQLVSDLQSR